MKKLSQVISACLFLLIFSSTTIHLTVEHTRADDNIKMLEKEASKGNVFAQALLGANYLRKEDYKKAKYWYEKAAEKGFADGQYNLGEMYYLGKGVKKNYKTAANYYKKAAKQDHFMSQARLGLMYYLGQGVKKDYKTARYYLEITAKNGHVGAQFVLGVMYAEGHGVRQNFQTAKELFREACDGGVQEACDMYKALK